MSERQDGLAESFMEKAYAARGRLFYSLVTSDVRSRIFGMRRDESSRWHGMKEDVVNTGTHESADQYHQGDARTNRDCPSSIERLHWDVWYVTRVQPVNLTP